MVSSSTGHKIWTGYADLADYCFLLCRTDPTSRRKDGLSVLMVDLSSPGIEVRPIATTLGYHRINEVFFDDVFVPTSALLGPENDGWRVATTALAFERSGSARYAACCPRGRVGRTQSRQRVGRHPLGAVCVAARLRPRNRAGELRGDLEEGGRRGAPYRGVGGAIHNSLFEQALSDFAEEVSGLDFVVYGGDEHAIDNGELESMWRNAFAATVTAGSYEIQSGVIAGALGMSR